MFYPEHLLPTIEKSTNFSRCKECYLIRFVKPEHDIIVEGNFNVSIIETKEGVNLSTNFIKCSDKHPYSSLVEDVFITDTDKKFCLEYFTPNNIHLVPMPENIEFTIDSSRKYFFLQIGDFDNISRQFPFNSPKHGKIKKYFTIKVDHLPNLINFFHFQINSYDENNKKISYSGQQWVREVISSIRELISSTYKVQIPSVK